MNVFISPKLVSIELVSSSILSNLPSNDSVVVFSSPKLVFIEPVSNSILSNLPSREPDSVSKYPNLESSEELKVVNPSVLEIVI